MGNRREEKRRRGKEEKRKGKEKQERNKEKKWKLVLSEGRKAFEMLKF